jgi:hypothetical protein
MLKASNKTPPPAMEYISVSTYTATVSATTHNVTAPTSYNAGDLIVILIASGSGQAQTLTDSGWTTVFNDHNGDAENTMHVAYRTAGTEPSTYGVTQASARGLVAACVVLRNAAYRSLASRVDSGSDSLSVSITTFNAATDGIIYYSALSTSAGRTATPPTGYTEIAQLFTSVSNSQVNLEIAYRVPNSSQSTTGIENLWNDEEANQSALFDFVNV